MHSLPIIGHRGAWPVVTIGIMIGQTGLVDGNYCPLWSKL